VMNEVWRGLERLSSVAYDLPQQTREILEDLRLGRLQMKTSNPELPPALDRLGRRAFSGLLVAALTVSGSQLVQHEHAAVAGYVLLSLAAVSLIAHLARDLRR
jgi:ubiquinone biosynthesis protein